MRRMASTARMSVVVPVGPTCDPAFIDDTLASIEFYCQPGYRLILADDSGRDLRPLLRRASEATIVPARAQGLFGLYTNLSTCFLTALDEPFDILLRLDTDALVIGSGFEALAADFFRAHPSVGILGAHDWDYDGTPADKSRERLKIFWQLTAGWLLQPGTSALIARLILRARHHGYYLGESVDGGVCIYSRAAVETLRDNSLLGERRLAESKAKLHEDHLFGLALRSCGMELADFGAFDDELPIGCHLGSLAAAPRDLLAAKKALVHSTKRWDSMDERAIRDCFARERA
jgi:hypothetical protein